MNPRNSHSREVRELTSEKTGKIYGINGPVIYLKGKNGFKMSEMVYVGKERLVGEVISLDCVREKKLRHRALLSL